MIRKKLVIYFLYWKLEVSNEIWKKYPHFVENLKTTVKIPDLLWQIYISIEI